MLITYHDEGRLLTRCLASLAGQLVRGDQVLIYDDASTEAATLYSTEDPHAEVYRGEVTRGPSVGRNVLLRQAKAEYVHFHDADDAFAPHWAQAVRSTIAQTGADAVFTEVASYRGLELVCERVVGLSAVLAGEDLVRFCLRGVVLIPAGTYRRDLVLAAGGFRESLRQAEDWEFHVRLAASGIRHAVVDDALVYQHLRAGSRSCSQVEVWSSVLDAVAALANDLPARYRPDLAAAAGRAGSTLFHLGARARARAAFRLATTLGPPFRERRPLYRLLTHALGPYATEWAARLYRRVLPERLRAMVIKSGW